MIGLGRWWDDIPLPAPVPLALPRLILCHPDDLETAEEAARLMLEIGDIRDVATFENIEPGTMFLMPPPDVVGMNIGTVRAMLRSTTQYEQPRIVSWKTHVTFSDEDFKRVSR